MKIKTRLTFLFTLIVAALLLLFSICIYYFSSIQRESEFYGRLKDKALTTAHLLIGKDKIDIKFLKAIDERDLTVLHKEEVMIFDHNDETIYDSGEDHIPVPHNFVDRVRTETEIKTKIEDKEVIGVLYRNKLNTYVVVASAYDQFGFSKLNFLRIILILGWIISIAAVLLAGWLFSSQALWPVSRIIKQVDMITLSNLHARLTEKEGKDELTALAQTFNRMLDRVESALEIQKSFVANASHELRTPLALVKGQIDVALYKERNVDEYVDVLHSIHEDIVRLTTLSNGLLDLAKVSGDVSLIPMKSMRVDEVLWQARNEVIKKNSSFHITIDFKEIPEKDDFLQIKANESLLKSAFINLMENGCKFSPDHRIQVELSAVSGKIIIEFADQGIGIEEKDLESIFQPFYRSSNVLSIEGHGIGLPLVKRIIDIHTGEILVKSLLEKGTTFKILIPSLL